MTVAVTGAGGFIGSALCAYLTAKGHAVVGLSRAELANPDFTKVKTVIHCAALAHRTGSERPTWEAFDAVNHRLAVELAYKARDHGVERFVFVSTIHTITGHPSPLVPNMDLAPRDEYGSAKAKAEQALLQMDGIDIVIARPVLVYGPGARANLNALVRLCDSILPLPFGCANNRRSMVSLENAVRALIFLADAPASKVAGRIFHLAEPEPRSTKELVIKIRKALGRRSNLLAVPTPIMKTILIGLGRSTLYEQLYADLVVDTTSLIEAGFRYSPGDPQLELMAKSIAKSS